MARYGQSSRQNDAVCGTPGLPVAPSLTQPRTRFHPVSSCSPVRTLPLFLARPSKRRNPCRPVPRTVFLNCLIFNQSDQ